jgi:hypothetical protein
MVACACFGCAGEQADNENMGRDDAKDFNARVTYRVQANLNGGEKNLGDILDDLDVPAYDFLCG